MPTYYYTGCPCCEQDCTCVCGGTHNCADNPLIWRVTVSGFEDQEEGCDCSRFNGTWDAVCLDGNNWRYSDDSITIDVSNGEAFALSWQVILTFNTGDCLGTYTFFDSVVSDGNYLFPCCETATLTAEDKFPEGDPCPGGQVALTPWPSESACCKCNWCLNRMREMPDTLVADIGGSFCGHAPFTITLTRNYDPDTTHRFDLAHGWEGSTTICEKEILLKVTCLEDPGEEPDPPGYSGFRWQLSYNGTSGINDFGGLLGTLNPVSLTGEGILESGSWSGGIPDCCPEPASLDYTITITEPMGFAPRLPLPPPEPEPAPAPAAPGRRRVNVRDLTPEQRRQHQQRIAAAAKKRGCGPCGKK